MLRQRPKRESEKNDVHSIIFSVYFTFLSIRSEMYVFVLYWTWWKGTNQTSESNLRLKLKALVDAFKFYANAVFFSSIDFVGKKRNNEKSIVMYGYVDIEIRKY